MVKYGMQARALAEQATRYVLARIFVLLLLETAC